MNACNYPTSAVVDTKLCVQKGSMDPKKLIEEHLGPQEVAVAAEAWTNPIEEIESPSPFRGFKLYRVRGRTRQFDFPMLPHCSYGIYAANGREAIRLTGEGKEIQRILAEDWANLRTADPVDLATTILWFYNGGIRASHHVLRDMTDLRQFSAADRFGGGYILNEEKLLKIAEDIGRTSMTIDTKQITLRALTVMGWMHDKRNFGVEMICISSDGTVKLDKRRVLARRIFRQTPMIRY